MQLSRKQKREKRHIRLRKKIKGTAERPRMAVFVSQKHMYVQLINDDAGRTLATLSTLHKEVKEAGASNNLAGATILGRMVGEKAKTAGIETILFDRGGFTYQGKVQKVAEAAREAGLRF